MEIHSWLTDLVNHMYSIYVPKSFIVYSVDTYTTLLRIYSVFTASSITQYDECSDSV